MRNDYISFANGGETVKYYRGFNGLATATITVHKDGRATLRIYCARQMIVKRYWSEARAFREWERFCRHV